MKDDGPGIRKEYLGEKPPTKTETTESGEKEFRIKTEKYGIGKPTRKIIKAKIAYDI